jgi:hypothetical protein
VDWLCRDAVPEPLGEEVLLIADTADGWWYVRCVLRGYPAASAADFRAAFNLIRIGGEHDDAKIGTGLTPSCTHAAWHQHPGRGWV